MRVNLLIVKVLRYKDDIDGSIGVVLFVFLRLPFLDKAANCNLCLKGMEKIDWNTVHKLLIEKFLRLLQENLSSLDLIRIISFLFEFIKNLLLLLEVLHERFNLVLFICLNVEFKFLRPLSHAFILFSLVLVETLIFWLAFL